MAASGFVIPQTPTPTYTFVRTYRVHVVVEDVAVLQFLVVPVLLAVEVPRQDRGEARLAELVVAILKGAVVVCCGGR